MVNIWQLLSKSHKVNCELKTHAAETFQVLIHITETVF